MWLFAFAAAVWKQSLTPPPAGKIDGGIDSVATYGDDLRSLTATCYDLPGIVPTAYVLLSGGAPFTRYTRATYLLRISG